MCWVRLVTRLPRHQRFSHGPSSRLRWRFWICSPILTRLKLTWYLLISWSVRETETQWKESIQYRVPTLGWPIATSCSVLLRSGGIQGHTKVTVPETIFLCTGTINLRAFTTPRKHHTEYWRWQTTTFVFYIITIYSNMEVIITLNLIMMKRIGGPIGSRLILVWGKGFTQGNWIKPTLILRQEGMRVIKQNLTQVLTG